MASPPTPPAHPLRFIQRCVERRRMVCTYHVNMRMGERATTREMIQNSTSQFEIIESDPDDRYLPSYLVYTRHGGRPIHVLMAVDPEADNVRIVTAHFPSPEVWQDDFKSRRES